MRDQIKTSILDIETRRIKNKRQPKETLVKKLIEVHKQMTEIEERPITKKRKHPIPNYDYSVVQHFEKVSIETPFEVFQIKWGDNGKLAMRVRPVGDLSVFGFECLVDHIFKLEKKWLIHLHQSGDHGLHSVILEIKENGHFARLDAETLPAAVDKLEEDMERLSWDERRVLDKAHIETLFGLKFDPSGWFEVEHNLGRKPRLKVNKLKAMFIRPEDKMDLVYG